LERRGKNAWPSLRTSIPERGYFQAWYQIGGILAKAKAPAAARLYLSYLISKAHQDPVWTFPVRTDVAPAPGLRPISEYSNASPAGFAGFMADRGKIERWRFIFEGFIGPVEGVDPNTLKCDACRSRGRFDVLCRLVGICISQIK
jgi:hypothetical protein